MFLKEIFVVLTIMYLQPWTFSSISMFLIEQTHSVLSLSLGSSCCLHPNINSYGCMNQIQHLGAVIIWLTYMKGIQTSYQVSLCSSKEEEGVCAVGISLAEYIEFKIPVQKSKGFWNGFHFCLPFVKLETFRALKHLATNLVSLTLSPPTIMSALLGVVPRPIPTFKCSTLKS